MCFLHILIIIQISNPDKSPHVMNFYALMKSLSISSLLRSKVERVLLMNYYYSQ